MVNDVICCFKGYMGDYEMDVEEVYKKVKCEVDNFDYVVIQMGLIEWFKLFKEFYDQLFIDVQIVVEQLVGLLLQIEEFVCIDLVVVLEFKVIIDGEVMFFDKLVECLLVFVELGCNWIVGENFD